MKYCIRCCGKFDYVSARFCPTCGERLRDYLVSKGSEIFVSVDTEDFVSGDGYHVGCGGVVEKHKTSDPSKLAYTCRKCCLRIEENEKLKLEIGPSAVVGPSGEVH